MDEKKFKFKMVVTGITEEMANELLCWFTDCVGEVGGSVEEGIVKFPPEPKEEENVS